MGRRRSEKTTPFNDSAREGMEEFIDALCDCASDDGDLTTIQIHITGKESETISMRLANPKELADFLRLSLKQ